MRLFLIPWLVFIISGCLSCSVTQRVEPQSFNPPSFVAPEPIYPTQSEYYVRVRAVIEYMTLAIATDDGEISNLMIFGESAETIKKELQFAEDVYDEIGLKFHIVKTEFREYGDLNSELLEDAAKYPDHMSIYYRMPRLDEYFEGLSGAPYEHLHSYGILLSYNRNPWTAAHEIGHYFGLLHTFMEDHCDDTPAETTEPCVKKGETKNCCNIMNYCLHSPKVVTPDQLERMTDFIRSRRFNVIINPPPTTPQFDLKEFIKEVEATAPNPTPVYSIEPIIPQYNSP